MATLSMVARHDKATKLNAFILVEHFVLSGGWFLMIPLNL